MSANFRHLFGRRRTVRSGAARPWNLSPKAAMSDLVKTPFPSESKASQRSATRGFALAAANAANSRKITKAARILCKRKSEETFNLRYGSPPAPVRFALWILRASIRLHETSSGDGIAISSRTL